MSVEIPIGAAADHRSWKRVADDATRTFGNAGKDAGREFANALSGSSKEVEQSLKRMGDRASDAYDKASDAVGRLKSEEAQLQRLRDSDADGARVIRQAEKVETARRAEARAVRDATAAYKEYQQASDDAGRRNNTNAMGGMRAQAGQAAQLGRDMADGFSGGFVNGVSGAASIARLGAAGGPIGMALMGLAAVGVLAGRQLADGIADGMAQLRVEDVFRTRMGIDPATMGKLSDAAGSAWAKGFGQSAQENLSILDLGFQARLIGADTNEQDARKFVERMQTTQTVTGEDPRSLALGARGLVSGGMVTSYVDAFDLIIAAQQKGLNLSGDMMDTLNEYAINFKNLGLSGSETLGLINQMFEANIRNTDLAADSLREFAISANDGSTTTRAAFKALGFDSEAMAKSFAAGGDEAKRAFEAIMVAMAAIEDPQQRSNIGLALFKTRWEEANTAIAAMDLKKAGQQFDDIAGKTDKASDALGEHANGWTKLGDTISNEMDRIGKKLADSGLGRWIGQGLPGWIGDRLTENDFDKQVQRGNVNFDERLAQSPFKTGAPMPASGTPQWNELLDLASTGRIPGITARDGKITDAAGNPIPEFNPPAEPAPNFYKDWYPGATAARAIGPGMPFDEAKKQIEAADKGDKTKPPIDPKLWSLEANPVAMPPGLGTAPSGAPGTLAPSPTGGAGLGRYEVDPMRVYDAESSAIRAKNSLEQDRIALIRLEQQGTADQDALLRTRNQVADAERSYVSAQMKLAEAQQGTWKKMEGSAKDLSDGMGQIGAALDKDFGISKGLPGMAENLVKFLANMAAAPLLGQLGAISAVNPSKGGYGAMGVLAAQGAFGPQYTGISAGTAAGPQGIGPAALGGAMGPYPGDAALMASVKAGTYVSQAGVGDLTQGIGDCSSAVEDLVDILDGRPTAGRNLSTGNAAEWLTGRGFLPGMGKPGDFQVGYNPAHMQATLPGGTNINWGSDASAAQRGMDGSQGAYDPAFTSHYYRPVTSGGAPTPAPVPVPAPAGANLAVTGNAAAGGYDPAMSNPALTNPGLTNPTLPATAGGGWGGPSGPAQAWSPSSTRLGGVEPAAGSGAGGVGITPGGTIDTAIGMAASAADIFAPGAGQAAQTGIKLANRAIQFGAQAAGIGVQGAMDTFLPTGGSELANKSWLTKILGGVAGAAPAIPNAAGKATAPPNPNQSDPNAQGEQGKAGDTHISVTNNRATEDGTGRDIAFHQQARNSGPGM
ncbi:phage tail tape measure protein [Mycobacterium sp. D16Q16]|uniref:phage tail tape measure protein n=1 Tax=Mycobacterium sp. D16Q16 TaxID=1855659 RepID=UPI000992C5F0|nr:phage tail tape measure protein [Mycobacterium sp. D16Q16]